MLRLIDYLLKNYNSEAAIKNLVDNVDIWINPLANPDGMYYESDTSVYGSRRNNANGIDLNRNFPDPEYGQNPDNNPTQPETIAMMNLILGNNFTLSANFHSGTEVINYPWDTWEKRHPDNDWYIYLSRSYVDTVYTYSSDYFRIAYFDNGITNGYDWYSIAGGRQDFMNYFGHGREVTIELSEDYVSQESDLEKLWQYNYHSLLGYINQALYGVHGIVTDSATNGPLLAKVEITGHDEDNSWICSDKDIGDYHRMLLPGTWNLKFSADGYYSKEIAGIKVSSDSATQLNVKLKRNYTEIDKKKQSQIMVFPNPAVNEVNIILNQISFKNSIICLYNQVGNKIMEFAPPEGEQSFKFNVVNVPAGFYLLYCKIENQSFLTKILVISGN